MLSTVLSRRRRCAAARREANAEEWDAPRCDGVLLRAALESHQPAHLSKLKSTDFHSMGEPRGDRATWRYTAKLDGGEVFKVKMANVRAVGAGGGAGAGKTNGKRLKKGRK